MGIECEPRARLSSARRKVVVSTFYALDRLTPGGGRGFLSLAEIEPIFSTSRHPAVVAGTITKREALQQFLSGFEHCRERVRLEEWMAYYDQVSAGIAHDRHFLELLEGTWARCLSSQPRPGSASSRAPPRQPCPPSREVHCHYELPRQGLDAQVDRLFAALRSAVTARGKSSSAAQGKRLAVSTFHEFDPSGSGKVRLPEFILALERFGLHTAGQGRTTGEGGMSPKVVKALFDSHDAGASGAISYHNFCDLLLAEERQYDAPFLPPSTRVSKPTYERNRWIKEGSVHTLVPAHRPSSRPPSARSYR